MSAILVIDDELSMRELLEIFLLQEGHEIETAPDGAAGLSRLDEREFDLVITDLRMPNTHGMVVLERCRAQYPETPVIVMTAFASTETAIQAMKAGAYDYFTKPFQLDAIKVVIDKALERRQLVVENRTLRHALKERSGFGEIIGRSRAMAEVFDLIRRAAPTRTNVLILGESGTGKELVARAIHQHSERSGRPFLVINCAAIPENLLESELFGHRKGTFTGATSDQPGLFRAADGGTLFLDEIGEMPLGMQVKLLRVLQERKVKSIGDLREVPIDVRVIAATNRDLAAEVATGRFREDLYYRLNVISLRLPPLRERPSDIPPLVDHFLKKYAREFGKPDLMVDQDAMQHLLTLPFSGNVRELENLVERAVALAEGPRLTRGDLFPPGGPAAAAREEVAVRTDSVAPFELPAEGVNLESMVDDLERALISQALERTGGHKTEAAKLLGISFRQLRYRLAKLNLDDDLDP